jgi:hypothetical protein
MLSESRRDLYHSYLLRLTRADKVSPWQASLQSTANGETRAFADLDTLWAFLLQEIECGDDSHLLQSQAPNTHPQNQEQTNTM